MRPESVEIKLNLTKCAQADINLEAVTLLPPADQASLSAFATQLSLPLDDNQTSKTQRVLDHLIAKSQT